MENYHDKVKFQYKVFSKIYDLMDVLVFPKKRANPRQGLVQCVPNENLSILDVCTGTGNSALALGAENSENHIIGIDLSEEMLRIAEKKRNKRGLTNAAFTAMDAAHLTLEEKYDIVTTSLSLHEMPQGLMDSVLAEMCRVLKEDGSLYIIEWEKPKSLIGSLAFMLFPYLLEPKGFGHFLKIDWQQQLAQYGLSLEHVEHYTFTKLIIARKTFK